MRKTTKGALALGTGVALLLGGAGTFAVWNGSADLGAESTTITAGDLQVKAVGDDVWKWADGSAFAPGSDKVVPGDTVTVTRSFDVLALGNHLSASVDISGTAIAGATLTPVITHDAIPAGSPATVGPIVGNTFTVSTGGSNGAQTFHFHVTYTIAFPSDATTGQNQTGSLEDTLVTVTQVVKP